MGMMGGQAASGQVAAPPITSSKQDAAADYELACQARPTSGS